MLHEMNKPVNFSCFKVFLRFLLLSHDGRTGHSVSRFRLDDWQAIVVTCRKSLICGQITYKSFGWISRTLRACTVRHKNSTAHNLSSSNFHAIKIDYHQQPVCGPKHFCAGGRKNGKNAKLNLLNFCWNPLVFNHLSVTQLWDKEIGKHLGLELQWMDA
jgi:hypothetical protein